MKRLRLTTQPSLPTRFAVAWLAIGLALMSRAASAEIGDEWPPAPRSCDPTAFVSRCAVRATLGDVESLPPGDRELNALSLLLEREAYNDAVSAYRQKVEEYRTSLEGAARPTFPIRRYPDISVLSRTPLLVRSFVLANDATDKVVRGTPDYGAYVRATAAKMGYPGIVLDDDLEQPALANGALCVGCSMTINTERGTNRVMYVGHGFVPITPWLSRAPKTTPAMAAAALAAMRPSASVDPPAEPPVLAVLRDPFGKGRLVWAIARVPAYVCGRLPLQWATDHEPLAWFPNAATRVFALDVDSLAIIDSFRSDLFEDAVAKAKAKAERKALAEGRGPGR